MTARAFPLHAARIAAALPGPQEAPLSARALHARIGIGSIVTTRHVLRALLRAGQAEVAGEAIGAGGWPMRLYRAVAL